MLNSRIAVSLHLDRVDNHIPFIVKNRIPVEVAIMPQSLELLESPRLADLAGKWRKAGVRFHSVHYSLLLPFQSPDPAAQELADRRLAQAAGLARLLGASTLSHHTGYVPPAALHKWHEQLWLNAATTFIERAQARGLLDGLCYCLENSYEDGFSLIEVLQRRFGVKGLFDLSHWEIIGSLTAKMTALEALERWRGLIGYLHVSDHGGFNDDHLPVGSGVVDWGHWCRCVDAVLPGATMVIEPIASAPGIEDDCLSGVRLLSGYLRQR